MQTAENKPIPTLEQILEQLKKIEDHPDTPNYIIGPEDWIEDGEPPYQEKFFYTGESAKNATYPGSAFLQMVNKFDMDIIEFVLDNEQKPIQSNVDALEAAGYKFGPKIIGEDEDSQRWLTFSIRMKHGLYRC